jgi:hypothetical protein
MPVPGCEPATSASARTLSSSSHTSATSSDRFGRSMPEANSGISSSQRPSTARMSRRTSSVAVAVSATVTGSPSRRRNSPTARYAGRRSWPHLLTQWASSIASSRTPPGHASSASAKPGRPIRSGVA